MTPRVGPLVLADISGYTAFVATTEIEHSREILTELLETVTDALRKHLEVVKLQGDALLAVGDRTGAELVEHLEGVFAAFHRRVRSMILGTTCPCNACVNVGSLTLKFVAHHGTFSKMSVRGAEDIVGADVNLACRLLKNHVPSREYVLATNAVLERIPAELRARYVPITEDYEDMGRVAGGYFDLAALRERVRSHERLRVSPDEAKARVSGVVPASVQRTWQLMTAKENAAVFFSARHVDVRPGAPGSLLGSEFHCHHGKEGHPPSVMQVISAAEPHEISFHIRAEFGEAYQTIRLEPVDDGHTRVDMAQTWDAGGLRSFIARLIVGPLYLRQELRALERLCRAPAPA